MQMQLNYTGRDGSKFLHVITENHRLTSDEKEMYNDVNFAFFATSTLQRTSRLIKELNFDEAKNILQGYKSSIKTKFGKSDSGVKKEEIEKFNERIQRLEKVLESKETKITGVKPENVEERVVRRGRARK